MRCRYVLHDFLPHPQAVDLSPSAVAGCSGYRSSSHNSPRKGIAPRLQRGPRGERSLFGHEKAGAYEKFEKIGIFFHRVCWEWGNFEKQTSESGKSGKVWKIGAITRGTKSVWWDLTPGFTAGVTPEYHWRDPYDMKR